MKTDEHFLEKEVIQKHSCYHCGEECRDEIIQFDNHEFCCDGCSVVYVLLKENDLCSYYAIDGSQGVSLDKTYFHGKFDYLDLADVSAKMLEFTDGKLSIVNWLVPKMHCSSCIWLLEQLNRLNSAIRSSVVNFPEKKVRITFNSAEIKLSEIAVLITKIGYEPYISLNDIEGKKIQKWNKTRIYKIGISGFAFGNIMLLSFPEYFHLGNGTSDQNLRTLFSLLNFGLSLPVFFYCANDFFKSAWSALKGRYLNIDAPIALALTGIFSISLYQILSQTGPGYFDSLAGAVFFMLIGRYFQDKTYAGISFDRDYKSYFPIAVTAIRNGKEIRLPITDLLPGDKILVRNQELIPADAVLLSANALIDYSFVSGESDPVEKRKGDTLYAGGKQTGLSVELEILRKVSQSYLTQLWNNETFSKEKENQNKTLSSRINRYFSSIVMVIATLTFAAWFFIFNEHETAFRAFTTSLLVACPCALLLSSTFTNGNLLSILGKNRFYPKNADAIERLSKIDTIVFDKTGTITQVNDAEIEFVGLELSDEELTIVKTLTSQSSHPLSRMLVKKLENKKASRRVLVDFQEINGAGMCALWGKEEIRLGSAKWVGVDYQTPQEQNHSQVYFSISGKVRGYFSLRSKYRPALSLTVCKLQNEGFQTFLLSGDKPTDLPILAPIFGSQDNVLFKQTPDDKLRFIENLQKNEKRNVLMIGDGLNDAGALRQSDVGLAVSDDINNFSPACDAILEGTELEKLPSLISLAKSGQKIIKTSFIISLLYNAFGLCFAVTGNLSPVIAAILMPVSSITIVLFTTASTNLSARKWLKS